MSYYNHRYVYTEKVACGGTKQDEYRIISINKALYLCMF